MSKKVDSSISRKISRWHFGEMLSHFLAINIILFVFFSIVIIGAGEKQADALIACADKSYSALSSDKPFGFKIPFLKGNDYTRAIIYSRGADNFWHSSLTYRVWVMADGGYAAYDYDFSEAFMLSLKFFIALVILESLLLIDGIGKSFRVTRSALRPLSELTETAQNISKLTGKLNTIDAGQLETRISLESPQKELSGLEDAINGMLDRINESYNAQVRFVSDASHELRTPIAVIQGYANLLDRWGKNDEKVLQESIDTIKSEAQNMKGLVEHLLFLARGDNNTMRLNIETLDIGAIVAEVVRETKMIYASREIEFEAATDELSIPGDAQLIKQALRILIDNSAKFSPENEIIKVSLLADGDKVKISISDNGAGIAPEDLPHIFDRFFRSDDSRTRKTGGSGLGLSIAKWIVESHGGSAEVVSRKDIGTRVTLTFDAVKTEYKQPEPQSPLPGL